MIKRLAKLLGRKTRPAEQKTASLSPEELFATRGRVVPDASRCVQCGVCGFNCPVGIPVRDYARQGFVVDDPACITCGQCINVCPRGTLRWESEAQVVVANLFAERMGYETAVGRQDEQS